MDRATGKSDPVEAVAAAITALGEDTAAKIAARAGMAYSTVTPKLRALEDSGRAERIKRDGRTLWRMTTDPTTQDHAAAITVSDAPGHAGHDTDRDNTPPIQGVNAADPPTGIVVDATETPAGPPGPAKDKAAAPAEAGIAAPADHTNLAAPAKPASHERADGAADEAQPADAPTPSAGRKTRRAPGELGRTALAIMQANPDTAYKVGELAKLIDRADEGRNYPKASPGAVVQVLDALSDTGKATKVSDRPATYQLA